MKLILYSILSIALFSFAACEDNIPDSDVLPGVPRNTELDIQVQLQPGECSLERRRSNIDEGESKYYAVFLNRTVVVKNRLSRSVAGQYRFNLNTENKTIQFNLSLDGKSATISQSAAGDQGQFLVGVDYHYEFIGNNVTGQRQLLLTYHQPECPGFLSQIYFSLP